MATYVIVCGPVVSLPASVTGYHQTENIQELNELICIDHLTEVNATVSFLVAPIQKPFCDEGVCNGNIYQVQ